MEAAQVAHGFLSLLRDLLPGDPYVPPKPWESVGSESGAGAGDGGDASNFISSAAGKPLPCYDPASVSEQAIAVPCFLEDVRKPLLHTGLQLQRSHEHKDIEAEEGILNALEEA